MTNKCLFLFFALMAALLTSMGGDVAASPAGEIDEAHGGMKDLAAIKWDDGDVEVFRAGSGFFAAYPRLIILSDGRWLCGYDTNDGGGRVRIQVSESRDGGKTFKVISQASFGTGDAANAQLLEIKPGELLLAYRLVNGDKKEIKVSRSVDGGSTWKHLSTVAQAVMTDYRGVWEPHMGLLTDGRLAVMYASEAYQPAFPQVIELKVSKDMGRSWGEPVRVSDDWDSRDGMPVWSRMADGRYIAVFEASDNRYDGNPFVVKAKISPDGLDWDSDRVPIYQPSEPVEAGAPFIIKLGTGHLLVSCQSTFNGDGGRKQGRMEVLLGAPDAKEFIKQPSPFASDGTNYWNSLMAVGLDGVAAATSNSGPFDSTVRLRKGRLVR